MAICVALINMKGGVGKTTLAAQIAHAAAKRDLRTLAVDLDPQSNLSQALLRADRYVTLLKDKKPTIVQLFESYLPPVGEQKSPQPFSISDIILKKIGYWSGTTLDLIPSRWELSHTLKNPTGKERRLAKALSKVSKDYDLILIDCAPTESILTEACLPCEPLRAGTSKTRVPCDDRLAAIGPIDSGFHGRKFGPRAEHLWDRF